MYCPNCGIEIHMEGSFCAKCRKNVAYLTKKENESKEIIEQSVVDSASETPDATIQQASDNLTQPLDKLQEKGYYCNYCGTFVYPEDHFCYDCGKKTRPSYYTPDNSKKKLYLGIVLSIVIGVAVINFLFYF